ncbi:unnamed protein product [Arctogadus glacialis]
MADRGVSPDFTPGSSVRTPPLRPRSFDGLVSTTPDRPTDTGTDTGDQGDGGGSGLIQRGRGLIQRGLV